MNKGFFPRPIMSGTANTVRAAASTAAPIVTPSKSLPARGWHTESAYAVALIAGLAFGPQGLAVVTPTFMSLLDLALPVALATLGAATAIGLPRSRAGGAWLSAASIARVTIVAGLVGGGMFGLAMIVAAEELSYTWPLVATTGIAAAMWGFSVWEDADSIRTAAQRLQHRDTVMALIIGGVLLAWARHLTAGGASFALLYAMALAVAITVAGWLLLAHASSEVEQRVFGLATLLLLGGVASALSVSALLVGLMAGATWRWGEASSREAMQRTVTYLRQPLLFALLFAAGAQAHLSAAVLMLAGGFVVLRTVGMLTARLCAPHDVSIELAATARDFTPGVLGIAFIENVVLALGAEAHWLISVIVLSTLGVHVTTLRWRND